MPEGEIFCTACGAKNPTSAQFCYGCGARIYRPATEDPKPQEMTATHAAALKCPNCGLINPGTAQRCDCGYDFLSGAVKEPPRAAKADDVKLWPEEQVRLRGVRGWLLLWCIITAIIVPVFLIVRAATSWTGVTLLVYLAFAGLAVFTGVSVWAVRRNALRLVKVYLVAMLCFALVEAFLVAVASGFAEASRQAGSDAAVGPAASLIRSLIGFYIWWSYFRQSKRVRATFGANL
jgi:ribosomal protein L40E